MKEKPDNEYLIRLDLINDTIKITLSKRKEQTERTLYLDRIEATIPDNSSWCFIQDLIRRMKHIYNLIDDMIVEYEESVYNSAKWLKMFGEVAVECKTLLSKINGLIFKSSYAEPEVLYDQYGDTVYGYIRIEKTLHLDEKEVRLTAFTNKIKTGRKEKGVGVNLYCIVK